MLFWKTKIVLPEKLRAAVLRSAHDHPVKNKSQGLWKRPGILFTGIPFVIINKRSYACHHRKDKMAATIKKKLEAKNAAMKVRYILCIQMC